MRRFGPYVFEIYYCTAFLVYSASFLMFFWELPSLLLRFSLSDIIGFFSYQLAFALFESILVAVSIIALVRVLPMRQVRDHRSAVGGLFLFSFAISALIFKGRSEIIQGLHETLNINMLSSLQIVMFLWLFTACGLPVASILMVKNEKIATRIKSIMENLGILASLYSVLSLLGIMIVMFRNLS